MSGVRGDAVAFVPPLKAADHSTSRSPNRARCGHRQLVFTRIAGTRSQVEVCRTQRVAVRIERSERWRKAQRIGTCWNRV